MTGSLMTPSSRCNSDSSIANLSSSNAGFPDSRNIQATESLSTSPRQTRSRTGLLSNCFVDSFVNGASQTCGLEPPLFLVDSTANHTVLDAMALSTTPFNGPEDNFLPSLTTYRTFAFSLDAFNCWRSELSLASNGEEEITWTKNSSGCQCSSAYRNTGIEQQRETDAMQTTKTKARQIRTSPLIAAT